MDKTIDLNADMGEYEDEDAQQIEASLFAHITSCNIACGGHTGTAETMRWTLEQAMAAGVQCGAHPSYPDRQGFGRQSIDISSEDLADSIDGQVRALQFVAKETGVTLYHLKPHGALYNDAAGDMKLAMLVTECAKANDLVLVGPPGSALETAALQADVLFVREGFIDRCYQMNGALVPRSQQGAVIRDDAARLNQARMLAQGVPLRIGKASLSLRVETLCIHSDSPGARETAARVATTLKEEGVEICAFKGEVPS